MKYTYATPRKKTTPHLFIQYTNMKTIHTAVTPVKITLSRFFLLRIAFNTEFITGYLAPNIDNRLSILSNNCLCCPRLDDTPYA